jgi:hypothetical protein
VSEPWRAARLEEPIARRALLVEENRRERHRFQLAALDAEIGEDAAPGEGGPAGHGQRVINDIVVAFRLIAPHEAQSSSLDAAHAGSDAAHAGSNRRSKEKERQTRALYLLPPISYLLPP